ncbi:MAG: hypothetical protein JWP60_270 [Ramlibacter sp.]|nr:hypothetical protein [Ramlibacter sp.]
MHPARPIRWLPRSNDLPGRHWQRRTEIRPKTKAGLERTFACEKQLLNRRGRRERHNIAEHWRKSSLLSVPRQLRPGCQVGGFEAPRQSRDPGCGQRIQTLEPAPDGSFQSHRVRREAWLAIAKNHLDMHASLAAGRTAGDRFCSDAPLRQAMLLERVTQCHGDQLTPRLLAGRSLQARHFQLLRLRWFPPKPTCDPLHSVLQGSATRTPRPGRLGIPSCDRCAGALPLFVPGKQASCTGCCGSRQLKPQERSLRQVKGFRAVPLIV